MTNKHDEGLPYEERIENMASDEEVAEVLEAIKEIESKNLNYFKSRDLDTSIHNGAVGRALTRVVHETDKVSIYRNSPNGPNVYKLNSQNKNF